MTGLDQTEITGQHDRKALIGIMTGQWVSLMAGQPGAGQAGQESQENTVMTRPPRTEQATKGPGRQDSDKAKMRTGETEWRPQGHHHHGSVLTNKQDRRGQDSSGSMARRRDRGTLQQARRNTVAVTGYPWQDSYEKERSHETTTTQNTATGYAGQPGLNNR